MNSSIKYIIAVFLMLFLECCNAYFKVTENKKESPQKRVLSLNESDKGKKIFILHAGYKAFDFENVTINADSLFITGYISEIKANHSVFRNYGDGIVNGELYKYDKEKYGNEYDTSDNQYTKIDEVHLYAKYFTALEYKNKVPYKVKIEFPLIDKVVLYNTSKGKLLDNTGTTAGAILIAAFCVAGGVALVGLGYLVYFIVSIASISLKTSCPFVYVQDNVGVYNFVGEIFSGSFYPQLERGDALVLPMNKHKDTLSIIIANELKERQFINKVDLLAIEHSLNSNIASDYEGNIYEIKKLHKPESAFSDENQDCINFISEKDSVYWAFSDNYTKDKDVKSLELKFLNAKSDKANLVLELKNSVLLDHSYLKFTELSGSMYDEFTLRQKKKSKEELQKWTVEQHIPLSIYQKNKKGTWDLIKHLGVVGPMVSKTLVVPLDISSFKEDIIEIKLETGTMFWEIDQVAMDFSGELKSNILVPEAISVKDEDGNDIAGKVKDSDNQYAVQNYIGNKIIANYKAIKPKQGNEISYVLKTSGYYEHIRDFKGKPDLIKLNKFKEPGYFVKFSRSIYSERVKAISQSIL